MDTEFNTKILSRLALNVYKIFYSMEQLTNEVNSSDKDFNKLTGIVTSINV